MFYVVLVLVSMLVYVLVEIVIDATMVLLVPGTSFVSVSLKTSVSASRYLLGK